MSNCDIKLEFVDRSEAVFSFLVTEELCQESGMMDETAVMLFIDNFSSICHKLIERTSFPFSVSVDLGASFYYLPRKGQRVYLHCRVFKNKGSLNCYSMILKDSDNNILASGRHTKFVTNRNSSHTIKDLKLSSL